MAPATILRQRRRREAARGQNTLRVAAVVMFTLPDESRPDPYDGLDDMTPDTRRPLDTLDWDEDTLPEVTVTQAVDAQGEKFIILDAAKEPIDSTRSPRRASALVLHWQEELYGKRGRQPGED